jgi:hypothetical protein
MTKKDELKGKMLTNEQCQAVRTMIILSIVQAVSPKAEMVNETTKYATVVANCIIEDTQRSLLQGAVFDDIVKNTPKKVTKKVAKNVAKKVILPKKKNTSSKLKK